MGTRRRSTLRRIRQTLKFAWRVLLGGALVAGMSVGLLFAYDVVTQIDYFNTDTIHIQGTRRLSEKAILDQAQLAPGVNIFAVNVPLTQKRLLAHDWIAGADIRRGFPNRITLRITEHEPVARLNLGRVFLINGSGEIFKELTDADADRLPEIEGLTYSDIPITDEVAEPPFGAVMEILKLGRQPGNPLPNRLIQKIRVDREMGVTLTAFGSDTAVKLGYNNYADKYRRLKEILDYLKTRTDLIGLRTIDLNRADRIVLDPVRETSSGDPKKEA